MGQALWSLICLVLVLVLFAIGASPWIVAVEPYRVKLVSAGLMFWVLAQMVGGRG